MVKKLLIIYTTHRWSWTLHIPEYVVAMPVEEIIVKRFTDLSDGLFDWADVILAQNIIALRKVASCLSKVVLRAGHISSAKEKQCADMVRRCKAVITQSKEHKADYDVLNENVVIIPNGVNLSLFKPGRVSGKFTIGYSANTFLKNGSIRGLYEVQNVSRAMDVPILYRLRGKKQIPHKDMPEKFYHQIDCLVTPYTTSGCCNVVMEALACGVPVISTKVGFHGENLDHEKNVLFVDKTVESIKSAVQRLIDEPDLRERLAVNGRKFAEEHHDLSKTILEYKKVLES